MFGLSIFGRSMGAGAGCSADTILLGCAGGVLLGCATGSAIDGISTFVAGVRLSKSKSGSGIDCFSLNGLLLCGSGLWSRFPLSENSMRVSVFPGRMKRCRLVFSLSFSTFSSSGLGEVAGSLAVGGCGAGCCALRLPRVWAGVASDVEFALDSFALGSDALMACSSKMRYIKSCLRSPSGRLIFSCLAISRSSGSNFLFSSIMSYIKRVRVIKNSVNQLLIGQSVFVGGDFMDSAVCKPITFEMGRGIKPPLTRCKYSVLMLNTPK